MPYIEPKLRRDWDAWLSKAPHKVVSEGELNYIITRVILQLFPPSRSYHTYNALIGVLECVKLELYRRLIAPYEDGKIVENGDVY